MKNQKLATFIYNGLGFPIELINVPVRKMLGEVVLDIDLNKLQTQVLKLMIQKPIPLQAAELKFIRKYLEMSTTAFGEVFGVTHAAVLKWENNHLPSPSMDLCVRMYVMDCLNAKDDEFGKLFHKVSMAGLAEAKKKRLVSKPLTVRIRKRKSNLISKSS